MDQEINITLKWDDAFLILKQLEYSLDNLRHNQKRFPNDPFFKERFTEVENLTEGFSLATGIRRFI